MTPKRWLIVAVWIIIMGACVTKFFSQNKRLGRTDDLSAVPSPTPQHFFALPGSNSGGGTPGAPKPDVADVQQVAFTVTDGVPDRSYFTCHVVLMNRGTRKATNVQIWVRPYRGTWDGDPENEGDPGHPAMVISDDSSLAQYGSWVSFPDIDPGQTVKKDVIYFKQDAKSTGRNPNPQITFDTDKPKSASPSGPQFPPNL